jgi:hypothetical protein
MIFSVEVVAHPGADWLPKFWWDFFSRGPKKKSKIAAETKLLSQKKKKNREFPNFHKSS